MCINCTRLASTEAIISQCFGNTVFLRNQHYARVEQQVIPWIEVASTSIAQKSTQMITVLGWIASIKDIISWFFFFFTFLVGFGINISKLQEVSIWWPQLYIYVRHEITEHIIAPTIPSENLHFWVGSQA